MDRCLFPRNGRGLLAVSTVKRPRGVEIEGRLFCPFNPQTTLSFSLPVTSHVRLTVYDVSGRLVTTLVDETRGAGRYDVTWDGRDAAQRQVSSGVYFYRIDADGFVETKRMVLLK